MDAAPLQFSDKDKGIFLLDATWRYAGKMLKFVESKKVIEKRSIPSGFRTAYPRRQGDCPDPEAGLASIEALYIAYKILERDMDGLLDRYYWKDLFLELNSALL
jgi:pre-rRNA-processing protein TSR3